MPRKKWTGVNFFLIFLPNSFAILNNCYIFALCEHEDLPVGARLGSKNGYLTGNFLKSFAKCLHDKIKCCIFASHLGSREP